MIIEFIFAVAILFTVIGTGVSFVARIGSTR